ncbi:MAG: peptidylprolyl isomerase [Ignavibacteriaceae bacterium]|nr:peptidylprolyl isomerase [Ignavibacteriaceae bacterium]
MKKIFALLVIIYFFPSVTTGQDTSVAKVGNSEITTSEMKERFQFTPQIYTNEQQSAEQKKGELLYSLIAEKLWALEAKNQKLDTAASVNSAFALIEKMYARDALYKAEISDKIAITEEELTREVENYFTTLSLYFLFTPDSSTINSYYQKLNSGAPVYTILTPGELEVPMIEVNYGDMKSDVEDELFSLKENEYTHPTPSGAGWIIFYVAKRTQKSFTSEDVNSSLKKVEKILRKKKEQKQFDSFMKIFFSGRKVTTNGSLFWSISVQAAQQLQKKKASNNSDSVIVYFDLADFEAAAANLGKDTLTMEFINLEDKPITVEQFLRIITFETFGSNKTDLSSVSYLLNKKVKEVIENELLAREAFARGYQNLAEVKKSIAMWRDNYLARLFKNEIISSVKVDESEVRDYYAALRNGEQQPVMEVNISEVLTDSLEVIEKVLNESKMGIDFRELAIEHTKRIWVKKNKGEFGFFPVNSYGEIGKAAARMSIGDVYGPIKIDEGYSVFKLLDKKETDTKTNLPFEQAKGELYKDVRLKKLAKKFIDTTVELANKYGVEVNNAVLNKLTLTDYQMLAFRYMGFGGRLLAVPLTLPFTEWVAPWLSKEKINP